MTIFSDLDGVAADFHTGFLNKFGVPFSSLNEKAALQMVNNDPMFFEELPLMPNAMKYWRVIEPYQPIIISVCPSGGFTEAAIAKKNWIKKHLGDVPFIPCVERSKGRYCRSVNDILIDDMAENIIDWTSAFGIGILFKDANQAINDFMEVMYELDN